MLGPLFECPLTELDAPRYQFDETDIAVAIKYCKMFLTTGVLPAIMVTRQGNGRFRVQTNVISFVVANTLSLSSIPAQELK